MLRSCDRSDSNDREFSCDPVVIGGNKGDMGKQTSLNRRGFLKGSTGAGLLICSSQVAFGYKANEKLNVACIGVGGQGVSNTRGVSGENVVAVCDVDEKRAAQMLKQYSGTKRYKDFRLMLSEMDKEIDAVVVFGRTTGLFR